MNFCKPAPQTERTLSQKFVNNLRAKLLAARNRVQQSHASRSGAGTAAPDELHVGGWLVA